MPLNIGLILDKDQKIREKVDLQLTTKLENLELLRQYTVDEELRKQNLQVASAPIQDQETIKHALTQAKAPAPTPELPVVQINEGAEIDKEVKSVMVGLLDKVVDVVEAEEEGDEIEEKPQFLQKDEGIKVDNTNPFTSITSTSAPTELDSSFGDSEISSILSDEELEKVVVLGGPKDLVFLKNSTDEGKFGHSIQSNVNILFNKKKSDTKKLHVINKLINSKILKLVEPTNKIQVQSDKDSLFYINLKGKKVILKTAQRLINFNMKQKMEQGGAVDAGTDPMPVDRGSDPISEHLLGRAKLSNLANKIINDIKNNRVVSSSDYLKLSMVEKPIIDGLINVIRLTKSKPRDDIDKLKNRFAVLSGELDAGNQSHKLIREMLKIIKKLKEAKVLSSSRYKVLKNILQNI